MRHLLECIRNELTNPSAKGRHYAQTVWVKYTILGTYRRRFSVTSIGHALNNQRLAEIQRLLTQCEPSARKATFEYVGCVKHWHVYRAEYETHYPRNKP